MHIGASPRALLIVCLLALLAGLAGTSRAALAQTGNTAAVHAVRTYFTLRRDFRRCVSPLCGGVFAQPLNLSATTCGDGVSRAECYAARVDWRALRLDRDSLAALEREALEGRAVVEGWLVREDYAGFGNLGRLVVRRAWRAATANPPGDAFYLLRDRGIVCVTAPCYSIQERLINARHRALISDIDLSPARATDEQETLAFEALHLGGFIASGEHVQFTETAGRATEIRAEQFYLPVRRRSRLEAR